MLVLPLWYQLTLVVPEKGLLNGCVCVCVCVCLLNWQPVQEVTNVSSDVVKSLLLHFDMRC